MKLRAEEMMRHLLRLALASRPEEARAPAAQAFEAAPNALWNALTVRLDEHRLLPLAYRVLAQHELLARVPPHVASTLKAQYEYSRMRNGLALLTLHGVSAKLKALGIETVACKGGVLASRYYHDLGMRWMNDIDLWIRGEDRERAYEALAKLGFQRLPEKSLPDGENFKNNMGITLDVHSRMRLFEDFPGGYMALTQAPPACSFRVFEPHALLAHLCAHMVGHLAETGPMLCWVIDLGFVIQKHRGELRASRLRELLTPHNWCTLLRTVRFLESELHMEGLAPLAEAARELEPMRLDTLLRLRRLSLWDLPRPAGWVRLVACALRVRNPGGRPWPSLSDLSLWPRDHAEQWWAAHKPTFSPVPLGGTAE